MELGQQEFSEQALRTAWKQAKNQDIAATIVGFIRQAALGDPLLPWADRVRMAIDRIMTRKNWSAPQRKWLERIGKAVAQVGVVLEMLSPYFPPWERSILTFERDDFDRRRF